jgi:hypothetical protein
MADKPHPAVELLLARMDSHPEEFVSDTPRVPGTRADVLRRLVENVLDNVEGPQVLPIKEKLDQLYLDMYHKELMDELLSGDDKRAQEAATQEAAKQQAYAAQLQSYPAHLQQSLAQTMQQAAYSQSPGLLHGLAGSSPSGYGGGGGGGSVAGQFYDVDRDMRVSPTITGTKANRVMIDDPVLDASMIKRMKKMMSGRSK